REQCHGTYCVAGGISGEYREAALDVCHDAQRDLQCLTTIRACHRHRCLTTDGSDEALELQLERLSLGRLERHCVHERFKCHRACGRETCDLLASLEPVEHARTAGQVQRQVAAALEKANLAHALPGNPACSDVRHCTIRECQARVGNVH